METTCKIKGGCPCENKACKFNGNCAECIRHHVEDTDHCVACMRLNFCEKETEDK